jgi:hypothetical protein
MGVVNIGAIAPFFQNLRTQRLVQVVHETVRHWQNEGRVDTLVLTITLEFLALRRQSG